MTVKRPVRRPKMDGIPPTIKEGFGYTYSKDPQSKLTWTIDGGKLTRTGDVAKSLSISVSAMVAKWFHVLITVSLLPLQCYYI